MNDEEQPKKKKKRAILGSHNLFLMLAMSGVVGGNSGPQPAFLSKADRFFDKWTAPEREEPDDDYDAKAAERSDKQQAKASRRQAAWDKWQAKQVD